MEIPDRLRDRLIQEYGGPEVKNILRVVAIIQYGHGRNLRCVPVEHEPFIKAESS